MAAAAGRFTSIMPSAIWRLPDAALALYGTIAGYGALWLGLIILLFFYGSNAAVAILVAAALWALISPFHAMQSLTVTWFATSVNTGEALEITGLGDTGGSTVLVGLKLAVFVLAFARVMVARLTAPEQPQHRLALRLVAFVVVAALLALVSSTLPDVSLFKLVLFLIGGTATLLAVAFAVQDHPDLTFAWIWGSCAAIVVLSAPLLLVSLGYVRNASGFQGWLNQPQAYGIFIAPVTALFIGLALFDKMWVRANLALGALATVELFATLSRNALLAASLGLVIGVAISFRRAPRQWLALGALSLIGLAVLILLPSTQAYVESLVRKTDNTSSAEIGVGEAFQTSRGFLIEQGLVNFQQQPLSGVGFGVAADPTVIAVVRDPIFGLPLSAPIEKGVVWIAALEEVGLIGTFVLVLLLYELLSGSLRYHTATGLSVAFAALMTNNGEATLFSFNGHGLFLWLLMAFAYGRGPPRVRGG